MCSKINITNKRANSGHINHLHTSKWWADVDKELRRMCYSVGKKSNINKGIWTFLKKTFPQNHSIYVYLVEKPGKYILRQNYLFNILHLKCPQYNFLDVALLIWCCMYVYIICIFIFGDKERRSALFTLRKVQQNSFDTALLLTCMTFFLINVTYPYLNFKALP